MTEEASEIFSPWLAIEGRQVHCDRERFAAPVDCVEKENLRFNRFYLKLLRANGLDRFEAFWAFPEGELIKRIQSRSVVRFTLRDDGRERRFYLKRHFRERPRPRLGIGRHKRRRPASQGMVEFDNCRLFRRHGLLTVEPVVAGERRLRDFGTESFLVTEDFAPFISLEDLIRDHPGFFEGEAGRGRKHTLLTEIARQARQMHSAGFHHLDFNATHILIHHEEAASKPYAIAFFDLQRVDINMWSRWRWMNKGLARLNYTLPDPLFSDEDRLHLFLSYKNRSRLDPWNRFQWFWLKRKTERIRRHTHKIDVLKRRERERWGIPEP